MSKYPYIGDNGNGTIVIFNKEARGFLIRPSAYSRREKGYYYSWNEDLFKNITREYLRNTKVKVESIAHEVFIRCLASEADLICIVLNGFAFIFDNNITDATKQITIPLPPTDTNTPEEDFEMTQIAKNNGDNLLFGGEDKCKEWPSVGDEVFWGNSCKGKIKSLSDGFAWIKRDDGDYFTVYECALKKPLTPEDELKQLAVDIWQENSNDFGDFMDVFANFIQKKPQ